MNLGIQGGWGGGFLKKFTSPDPSIMHNSNKNGIYTYAFMKRHFVADVVT